MAYWGLRELALGVEEKETTTSMGNKVSMQYAPGPYCCELKSRGPLQSSSPLFPPPTPQWSEAQCSVECQARLLASWTPTSTREMPHTEFAGQF